MATDTMFERSQKLQGLLCGLEQVCEDLKSYNAMLADDGHPAESRVRGLKVHDELTRCVDSLKMSLDELARSLQRKFDKIFSATKSAKSGYLEPVIVSTNGRAKKCSIPVPDLKKQKSPRISMLTYSALADLLCRNGDDLETTAPYDIDVYDGNRLMCTIFGDSGIEPTEF